MSDIFPVRKTNKPSFDESPELLVKNPWAALEDKSDPSIPTATLQIYQGIDAYLARGDDRNVDRASAATMCVKRRQYKRMGEAETPLTPRKIVNFLLGDLSERVLLYFIKEFLVGPGKLYSEVNFGEILGSIHFQGKELHIYNQKTMSFLLDGVPITAHGDGFGKRNVDGKWESIECKSAANWGFKSFQEVGPEDYKKQSTTVMMTDECRALEIKDTRYFYLRKETGHIWDRLFSWDEQIAKKVVKEFRQARRDDHIPAPHPLVEETYRKKPTGKMIANFPCTYCPFLEKCHGKFEVEWKPDQWGNFKPVYVFSKEKTNAV